MSLRAVHFTLRTFPLPSLLKGGEVVVVVVGGASAVRVNRIVVEVTRKAGSVGYPGA